MDTAWTLGMILMPLIEWLVDLLNKLVDGIDHWRRRQSEYYNCQRLFQDLDRYRIPGDHWYNEQVYSCLLAEFKLYLQGGTENEIHP